MQLNISRRDTHYEIIAVQTLCKYMKKYLCLSWNIFFVRHEVWHIRFQTTCDCNKWTIGPLRPIIDAYLSLEASQMFMSMASPSLGMSQT